jgi:hypothetical protein
MEYKIIDDESPAGLAKKVNEAIKEGWKPQGGVGLSSVFLWQAMIRESQKLNTGEYIIAAKSEGD